MIYSDAFDQLPEIAKNRLYSRLWEVLSAETPAGKFAKLPGAEREEILEILKDTKPDFKEFGEGRSKT